MSYYDIPPAEREEKGLDYDLCACLEYNPQDNLALSDIQKVIAVYEGENDEEDWRWVLLLNNGRYAFLQGGCGYTGWDCQSWASAEITDTPEDAAKLALGDLTYTGDGPAGAGLGHMMNILAGTYGNKFEEVYASLMQQIADGKNKTWREKKDQEFGL